MIDNFSSKNFLRHPEFFQFMVSARDIFSKSAVIKENAMFLFNSLDDKLKLAETLLAAEKRNDKLREKNDADEHRDNMHSKLFNYLKTILYDRRDARYEDAQAVMRIVRETGNPTRLSENLQSAMMTTLGNKLEPYRPQLEAIGALQTVDDMIEANRRFIEIENELREMATAKKLSETPTSMGAARKQIDPIYRSIVSTINTIAQAPAKADACKELITEMNVLIARYDAMVAARKRETKEKETNVCPECKQ